MSARQHQPLSAPTNKPSSIPAFLEKLYDILSDVSNNAYIAWQADGTAFLIKKVPELQEIVLPKYFKHNNLQSFVRQLNMYNFAKTCHDPNYREFRNPYFLQGRRDLLSQIRRKAQSSARDQALAPLSSSVTLSYKPASVGPSGSGNGSESLVAYTVPSGSMEVDWQGLEGDYEVDAGSSSFSSSSSAAAGQRSSSRKRTSTFKVQQGGSRATTGFLTGQDLRSRPSNILAGGAQPYGHTGGDPGDDGANPGQPTAADDKDMGVRCGGGTYSGKSMSDMTVTGHSHLHDDGSYPKARDDYGELVVVSDDLRWRVRQLETTNTLLMER